MLIYQLTLYSIISLGRTIMEIQSALAILDTNTSKLLLLFKEYSMQTFPVLFYLLSIFLLYFPRDVLEKLSKLKISLFQFVIIFSRLYDVNGVTKSTVLTL